MSGCNKLCSASTIEARGPVLKDTGEEPAGGEHSYHAGWKAVKGVPGAQGFKETEGIDWIDGVRLGLLSL
jgi:hypothetical protein